VTGLPARGALPTGTVTFLFSDIEGSTRLAGELDPAVYRELLEQHHALLRAAFGRHAGVERGTQGDSFLVIFTDPTEAVAAAVDAQRALGASTWPDGREVRVRMGIHSGQGIAGGDDYVGIDIDRAARIAAAAHGGQVVVSDATRVLAERGLPVGVGLRDLGRHRLKDLPEPERVHQLVIDGLADDFPPLRTAGSGTSGLPPRLTSFVGRERELGELRSLVATARVLTLTGPGGTGKTSLALELARGIADDYEDGAFLVALEPVTDPGLVASAIVAALGLRDLSGRPARDRLLDNLAARRLVLILDNFEHVLEAADLVSDIAGAAPGVTILVTSRAPLRIGAEQVYPIEPLPLPSSVDTSPEAITASASVRLFVERARRALPAFRLTAENAGAVADICHRLDGLPLGIELAAARIGLLGVEGVRDRLGTSLDLPGSGMRDAPARQRTLHAVVQWSHDLLDVPARQLFASLAVFVGGCRPAELEAVCGPGMPDHADTLDAAGDLLEQSLVRSLETVDGVRFDMLETIRMDAAERFAGVPTREAIRRAHAHAYLALAAASDLEMQGRRRARAIRRLERDADNCRVALHWAVEQGEAEIALRLTMALGRFWALRGEMDEARGAVAIAMSVPGAEAPTQARMRALEGMGTLAYYTGRIDEAADLYHQQLELARSLGDRLGTADALFNLCFTRPPSETATTTAWLDEADAIYSELGDGLKQARVLWARGAGLMWAGQAGPAVESWERAYEGSRAHDDVTYESLGASSLAAIALESGRVDQAVRWYREILMLGRDMFDAAGITLALPIAAAAVAELVGPEPAATMMGAHETLTRRFGITTPPGLTEAVRQADPTRRISTALDPEAIRVAMDRGRSMGPEEAADFVLDQLRLFDVPPTMSATDPR
jgi:predicted ATPase/class 3 adenylate cyclase